MRSEKWGGVAEIVGSAIALAVLILILVTELEIDLTKDGLAVGETGTIAPIGGWCHTIAADGLYRVRRKLIITQIAVSDALAGSVAPVTIDLECEVTAIGTEATIELEHTSHIL